MQRNGGLSGGLWTVYLDNTTPWQAANAKSDIQPQRTGGDSVNVHMGSLAQLHDGTFSKLLFYLVEYHFQRLFFLFTIHHDNTSLPQTHQGIILRTSVLYYIETFLTSQEINQILPVKNLFSLFFHLCIHFTIMMQPNFGP